MAPVTRYRGVAVLALVGLFISAYLLLHNLGYYGDLICGTGSCEAVQTSEYAVFLGVPVPAWGTAWYAGMLVLSLMAAARPPADPRGVNGTVRLVALGATAGLLFSAYLSSIEAFVLDAWCRWCIASAVLTVLIFGLAAPWRALRSGGRQPS